MICSADSSLPAGHHSRDFGTTMGVGTYAMMRNYKASHSGLTTAQFVVKLIDYFLGLNSISSREDSFVLDLGSGEGIFGEVINRYYRDLGRVWFWGIELDATLYEVSRGRLEKLNDRPPPLLMLSFCHNWSKKLFKFYQNR